MSTFVGGALKLKGGLPIEKKKKKKKKAPKEEAEGGEGVAEGTGSASETRERGSGGEGERKVTSEGYELLDDDESGDKRTEAQKRFDEMMLRRHLKDLKKGKTVETHVEKVQRLNDYLSKLSEHHDIPKVDGSW